MRVKYIRGKSTDDKATIIGRIPTKPDSVSQVTGGATDVANELAKNWTGHDLPVPSLQVVRAETEVYTVKLQNCEQSISG